MYATFERSGSAAKAGAQESTKGPQEIVTSVGSKRKLWDEVS